MLTCHMTPMRYLKLFKTRSIGISCSTSVVVVQHGLWLQIKITLWIPAFITCHILFIFLHILCNNSSQISGLTSVSTRIHLDRPKRFKINHFPIRKSSERFQLYKINNVYYVVLPNSSEFDIYVSKFSIRISHTHTHLVIKRKLFCVQRIQNGLTRMRTRLAYVKNGASSDLPPSLICDCPEA